MQKLLSSVLFLSVLFYAHAQNAKNVEDHQIQLSLPMPGVLYERGITANSTLSVEAITDLWVNGGSGRETRFGVYPILRGQYRYYYNMEHRLGKGKNITGNTGNYIGGMLVYQNGNALFGDLNSGSEHSAGVGPVYGLQRTYKRGFFYRLETGIVYAKDDFGQGFLLVLAARIGWVIRKRR